MKKRESNQEYRLITLPNKIIKVLADGKFSQLNTVDMEQLFHALMFQLAYPQSVKQEAFTLKKLKLLTAAIKNKTAAFKHKLQNSGLPFTIMSVQFTHDFLQWLLQQKELKVKFQQFVNKEVDLLVYISENLSNIYVSSEIDEIIDYLKDTEKIIDEISLEHKIR